MSEFRELASHTFYVFSRLEKAGFTWNEVHKLLSLMERDERKEAELSIAKVLEREAEK